MGAGLPRWALILIILFYGAIGAHAQTAGSPEAAGPDGALMPSLSLTPVQRSEIYGAVMQGRAESSSRGIAATIGAAVPPSADLRDLPDQAVPGTGDTGLPKYATVADDVVLVDPILMRVIDVIHRGARP